MTFPTEEDDPISVEDDQIRRTQLQMQFHGTRKEDHETVGAYVNRLKSLADSLAEIGSPISDPDTVLQLLAGLPSEYSPLQKTISSRCPLPTFGEACSLVYMQEEILLQQDLYHREQIESDHPHDDGGEEQSSGFCTLEKWAGAVCTVGSVVGAVVTVVGAAGPLGTLVGAAGASRMIVVGAGAIGAVASWKFWK